MKSESISCKYCAVDVKNHHTLNGKVKRVIGEYSTRTLFGYFMHAEYSHAAVSI